MAPLKLQPHKYFGSGPEEIHHYYSPFSGGSVVDNPAIVDPRILTSLKSGISFDKLSISITNKRIKFDLIMPSCSQELEMCYQDLSGLYIENRELSLADSRGLKIWLYPTRPHFVAIELWVQIAHKIIVHYINSNDVLRLIEARNLISAFDVSTLKVPDDFLGTKGEEYSNECANMGFCLPINSPPYWSFENFFENFCGDPELYSYIIKQTATTPVVHTIDTQYSGSSSDIVKSNSTTVAPFTSSVELFGPVDISSGSATTASPKTTADLIRSGGIEVSPGTVPTFKPSLAELPAKMRCMDSVEDELQFAIWNSPRFFQSFYNDLQPLTSKGLDDDVIGGKCFDEELYCRLVKEMHRYTIAEIAADQDNIAKKYAGLGVMVGSVLTIITGNILAPFMGHTYGKSMTDRSRRIEEFLPDPNLLFLQDPNSFLSWSRGQMSPPRLRRLILHRQVDSENRVYFRLLPAIVTADSVYPIQLFKLLPSTYFYRPLAAGIGDESGRKQKYYDAIRIQKRYFHIRAEGKGDPTDISLRVSGRDIEDYDVKLYRFVGHSLDYFYADFKIQPGSVF
jgi:hypothetical protein